jgi:D-arabinono-1,4-lactone oxidase
MACPSKQITIVRGAEVTDLLALHPFRAGVEFQPANKAELVAAVTRSAQARRSLRALGSNWSLSEAGVADDVVCTDKLEFHLSQPYAPGSRPLTASQLRGGVNDFLKKVCAGDERALGRYFVHVEAGIKIRKLLLDLKGCGLALPTMGAGGGQSLAGALATGTHGADFQVPPLVEWIRAIHLVGPGGQEWWITPEVSLFATERVLNLQDWCDDARIVANDHAFDAVRVGVGRMGVIYSMILEVVPAYSLIEVNFEDEWGKIREQLGVSRANAADVTGVFDTRLRDLDSGWFRSEMLGRTEVTSPHGTYRYAGGPNRHVEPPASPQKESHYREMLKSLKLDALAGDLRGSAARQLHHINIVLNLARPDQCWVTRRWKVPGPVRSVGLERGEQDPILETVIRNKTNPTGIVKALQDKVTPKGFWGVLTLSLGRLFHVAQARRFDQFRDEDIPRIARQSATSGEALFLILYKLATDPVLGPNARKEVIQAVSGLIGGFELVRAGLSTDVIDTHKYDLDGAQSGNSAEYFFDAAAREYLAFIDAVVALCNARSPVLGYMGIRFTPRSTALIAMQRFALTVSVEVATARARQEDVYVEFWNEIHRAANERGAIPHWGQQFRQPARGIASHYGDDLLAWRRMLAELSIDAPNTFSTPFSRANGLEPTEATGIFDAESLDLFLAGLEAAAD